MGWISVGSLYPNLVFIEFQMFNKNGHDQVFTYMSPDSDFQTQTQIFRLRLRFSDSDFFLTIVLGLNLLFFRYLSKIDAPAHLRLYFKHICAVLLFLDFPGKLPL